MKAIDPGIQSLPLRIYAKDQPQYMQLPARVDRLGAAITCWQLSWRERLQMLLFGRFYLTVLTFHQPLQPLRLDMFPPELDEPSCSFPLPEDGCQEKLA